MDPKILPSFPYGAVYFRKSNPPREDWQRDYGVAREDGMNIFRHWLLWSAVETSPGTHDWEEYDKQFDLASSQGMKTVVAEMITSAPEWAFRKYAHARFQNVDGKPTNSHMQVSCVSGGFPGLCLDNDDYRQAAGAFLKALATRYKDHPGLGGYDIWNECNYDADTCFCPATQAKFRLWLEKKYGTLAELSAKWHRYGFSCWEDVTAPSALGPYPDSLDWLEFRKDNAYELMRWRAEIIRSVDQKAALIAHGIAGSLTVAAARGGCDWRAAAEVEIYGLTWGSSRHGDEGWKQFHAMDLVRASSRGKPFWHAEAYAGPLWMQPQVIGKPRDEGRIPSAADASYWNMVSFMSGASGLMYLRWRPLLDGPLFGAFGAYGMDGSRTDRSQAVSEVAKWITSGDRKAMLSSRPVRGQVGILYVPETQTFTYAQQGNVEFYSASMQGAYQGFFDLNIQADWVHIDDIAGRDLLYLPFPVMLSLKTVQALKAWVAAGGTLVCEGCPGYFGDGGRAAARQPGFGLDELFGARESYVEFTPDLLKDASMDVDGSRIWGGIFLQSYEPTGGTSVGFYPDGRVAAVDNTYGKGKVRLVGSMAGYGYASHGGAEGKYRPPAGDVDSSFFAGVLAFAGKERLITSSDMRIKARLHEGSGGTWLWVANPTRSALPVRLSFSAEAGTFARAEYSGLPRAGAVGAAFKGGTLALDLPARSVSVYRLS